MQTLPGAPPLQLHLPRSQRPRCTLSEKHWVFPPGKQSPGLAPGPEGRSCGNETPPSRPTLVLVPRASAGHPSGVLWSPWEGPPSCQLHTTRQHVVS